VANGRASSSSDLFESDCLLERLFAAVGIPVAELDTHLYDQEDAECDPFESADRSENEQSYENCNIGANANE